MIRIHRFGLVLPIVLAVATALPSVANARVYVGVGIPLIGPPVYIPPPYYPPPVYYPPPAYYPPPVIYAPAPVTYAPPAPQAAQSCQAGAYICPMDRPTPPGNPCYCLGNGGQKVWGRTN